MLIAIISDIHGNLPALEAVLTRIKELNAGLIYCLGDTVGYGPFPSECVKLVRERCSVVLKGNHDSGLVGETPLDDFNHYGLSAIQWTRTVVSKEDQDYLRGLPTMTEAEGITLAHSSPLNPGAWSYVLTMRAAHENFAAFTTNLCFIGHTHVPIIVGEDGTVNKYSAGARHLINVGSVGQPRDGSSHAAFGLYDTETAAYQLVRVQYDIQVTARAIRKLGLPEFLAQRLFQGV